MLQSIQRCVRSLQLDILERNSERERERERERKKEREREIVIIECFRKASSQAKHTIDKINSIIPRNWNEIDSKKKKIIVTIEKHYKIIKDMDVYK